MSCGTPLAAISNAVQLLRKGDGNTAATGKHWDMIERQLEDLTRLVDDLLDTARIERDEFVIKKEAVDLAQLVNEVFEATQEQLRQQNHQL